jgi:predicted alpha/beta hydrolase family esterase
MNEKLNSSNLSILIPEFPNERETSYAHWKEKINTLNIANFDTLVAHSFGCPVVMQYIIENQIHIDRLVLIAPSGLVGNEYLEKVIPEMTMDVSELKKYVSEIVIIHSKDDASESGKFEYGKNLAEKI